jgi:hypothetical protein
MSFFNDPGALARLQKHLQDAYDKDKPLPRDVLYVLLREIKLLRSGRKSTVFKTTRTKSTIHPVDEILQRDAVSYILTCQKSGREPKAAARIFPTCQKSGRGPTPIKTICKLYGVSNSTVHRWKAKYEDVASSNLTDKQVKQFLRIIGPQYRRMTYRPTYRPR